MRTKIAELIPIQEAMDNLASIAGINMESPPPMGVLQGRRIVTSEEELNSSEVRWVSGEGSEVLLQLLDETYRAVLAHLTHLYELQGMDWGSAKTREGVSAMMSLVGESAAKMDLYLAYRFDRAPQSSVEERESFQKLQRFYTDHFAKKFGQEGGLRDTSTKPLAPGVDFEEILKDRDYELFYIVREDGKYYLDAKTLRDVQLTVEFDLQGGISFEDDPFFKARAMWDRDIQASAMQILTLCRQEMQLFYEKRRKFALFHIASSLNKAVMALFLAANPRHLLQRTSKKNSAKYFADFHMFLREALKSSEYQKWLAYPPSSSEKEAHFLLGFVWRLCSSLVERAGGIKQEAIGLIHRTMRRGEEMQAQETLRRGKSVWDIWLYDDEQLRNLLRQFPKGPLLKVLEIIRHGRDEGLHIPFDPWIQDNLPSQLYHLVYKKRKVDVLRIPAPIRQGMINKVEIIDEFRGFLLSLSAQKKRHLLIQLQDRLSWKEASRSQAIEELANSKAFSSALFVLTLPKDTEFYHQSGPYADAHQASQFLKELHKQLESPLEHGFYFPPGWKAKDLKAWQAAACSWIHKVVFEEKEVLTRRQREDFIEIFYQILVAQAIVYFDVDSVSFTCKDGVDTGAVASALFYGCIELSQEGFLSKEQLDMLKYLTYWPALSIRERAVDPERCIRMISALETLSVAIEAQGTKPFQSVFEWLGASKSEEKR